MQTYGAGQRSTAGSLRRNLHTRLHNRCSLRTFETVGELTVEQRNARSRQRQLQPSRDLQAREQELAKNAKVAKMT